MNLVPENDEDREQIYSDFKSYVRCPLLAAIQGSYLFDLMTDKWKLLGYPGLGNSFSTSWRGNSCTYVEVNQNGSAVVGGAVNTNNNTESHNAKIKLAAQRKILRLHLFLPWLTSDFGVDESIQDASFGSAMNRAVHCGKFYIRVRDVVSSLASSINVRFKSGDSGSFIIPSARVFQEATSELEAQGVVITAASVSAFLTEATDDEAKSRLGHYIAFRDEPRGYGPRVAMDFDTAVLLSSAFYVLYPITDRSYISRLYVRLQSPKMDLMPLNEVMELGHVGLMACGCPSFLQRAWCKHSCADAIQKKIILSYPKTMRLDPTPLGKDQTKNGKSKKGGARGFE